MINALRPGIQFSKALEPRVARLPLVGVKSLMATGKPCNSPPSSPRNMAVSTSVANAIASSRNTNQKQLSAELTSSIRARQFSMISTGEISRVRIRAAGLAAGV
jgi:hypothetical protein